VKKVLIAVAVLGVLAAVGGGAWWMRRQQQLRAFGDAPFGASGQRAIVDVPPASGPRKVAELLAAAGVVGSAEDFYAYVRMEKAGPKLKAGEYEFETPVSPAEIVAKLAAGKVRTYRVTIPEGLRVDEILDALAKSELKLDRAKLDAVVKNPELLQKAGLPTKEPEGFLYPDTYLFTRGFTEESAISKMVARALEEYRAADAQRKPGVKLGLLEAFTLASIVEKETGAPDERPRIACVFHNRLKLKMKLQTDPTVIYAMMLMRGTYSKNITRKDLETEHPYNTYAVKGLPPGPIASPGSAALRAALNPIDCQDLFFVSRNDGTHIFCPDLQCHEAAVQQWQIQYFRSKRKQAG
jgi:UPF0755 protein